MDQLGILLKLKDLFKDTCRKQEISYLIQSPLIYDYLKDPVNLKFVIDNLGNESRQWTSFNISKIAAGVDIDPSSSNNPVFPEKTKIEALSTLANLQSINKINALFEIYPVAKCIAEVGNKNSWQEIFEKVNLGSYLFTNSKKILETVFSVVYELIDNKSKFISGLLDYSVQESGSKLLAHLLIMNKSVRETLIDSLNIKFLKTPVENFLSCIRELQFLGDQTFCIDLARKFTEIYPYDERTTQNNVFQALPDDLTKLLYLKNYSALFQIIGDEKAMDRISLAAKEVLSSVGQKLGFKSYFENQNLKSSEERIIGSESCGTELIQEISRIRNVIKTDIESAISIADEFSRKILNNRDIGSLIFHRDLGYLIKPEELPQVFIDLGLFVQSQAILKKLLKLWPQNILLLRMAANLTNENGNHQKAISLYTQLDILDSLTREEKIKFASSLEYLDRWNDAFNIRKGINSINDTDLTDAFICAYYAGNSEALKNLTLDNKQWTQSSTLTLLLLEITKEDKEQIDNLGKKLSASDFSNEKNQKGFLLVADYFHKTGEIEKAVRILEECAKNSLYSCSIVNRLYFYFQEMGESEKSRLILETEFHQDNNDQKSFEIYINYLVHNGEIDKADQLLRRVLKKWELSPFKLDLSAKILIGKRKFLQAKIVLRSLIEDNNCDVVCKFDYCLALLECRVTDFPFGIDEKKSGKFDEIRQLLDFRNQNGNIFLEMLEAELDYKNRLEKYQQLLQKYSGNHNSDTWRIFAGLGRVYFDLKQYDSAIINIKHACQTVPNNGILFWLLIRCYSNLRLWNEIENLFSKSLVLDKRAIINGFRHFEDHSENLEWSRFFENQVQKNPDEIIYKILLAQSFVETEKKFEAAELAKSFFEKLNVENEYYLFCVQILIDADNSVLAERLIEIYLSNKKSLDQKDYLSCTFLYDQLKKPEKALAMINHLEYQDISLLTYKAKLINDFGNIDLSQSFINQIIDYNPIETINIPDISVRIPEAVKLIQDNPALAYLVASSIVLKSNNIDQAISILEIGLKKYPDNQEIFFNMLELLNITGMNEDVRRVVEEQSRAFSEIQSPSLFCLLGEIALSQKEEVTCARYLSEAIKLVPENSRVKALQARMVAINGNLLEAQNNLSQIIKELDKNEKNHLPIINSVDHVEIESKLWLANAALELKDFQTAIIISQQEINDFGYYTPSSIVFLSALSSMLENQFILREIKVNSHLELIEEDTLKSFSAIVDNLANAHSNSKELDDSVIKCQIFLENNSKAIEKAEELYPEIGNINSILYAIFKTKGKDAAEIAFNSLNSNLNNELFIALMEKNDSPQEALHHLKKFNNSEIPDARSHALLAIIEKNMGNLSDAYAAICLALDQWSDEYEWQIMAGDLSKAVGDLHTSISHYEKAQRINLKQGLDKNIEALYLSMEIEDAIPILEKQLLLNPNEEQLIQLGKIYVKFGNFRKAINVFKSAIKLYPHDATPHFWLSEIALKLNNSNRAMENIEKAITYDVSNNRLICKKTQILNKIYGYAQALKFLDGELSKKNNSDDELLLYKIKLISENEGDKTALRLLNSINNLKGNSALLLEKAKLELRIGNLDVSESIAEELLNQKDHRSDALTLLGSITKARGEFDRSIDFYIKAIELNPFSTEQFVQLAEIYNDRKDFKQAMDTLEDGIKTNPGNFYLLYKTGLNYYQHGLYSEAEKRIKEAIRIEPDHRESKEILGLLKNVMTVKTKSLVNHFVE